MEGPQSKEAGTCTTMEAKRKLKVSLPPLFMDVTIKGQKKKN